MISEESRTLAERMQGQIIGEINLIKKVYVGNEPLATHLSAIEGYVDIALECLKKENLMEPNTRNA